MQLAPQTLLEALRAEQALQASVHPAGASSADVGLHHVPERSGDHAAVRKQTKWPAEQAKTAGKGEKGNEMTKVCSADL